MVRKYQAEVVSHENLIDNIYTLKFKSLGRKFKFLPGQFLHIAIDDYDGIGQWPESRCFSMHSPPGLDTVQITYASKGSFTNQMAKKLTEGSTCWLKMPYGNIFQGDFSKENAVFIAGGTGITPFLSLFTSDAFSEFTNPILFFGIREKKYHLYESEFESAKKINEGLTIYTFIEEENGRPDVALIREFTKRYFFLSGPPQMINYYKKALIERGVSEEKIITDDWE